MIDVDELTWLPNWVEVPHEEQVAKIAALVAGDEWVIDTAYGKWLDIVLSRTEIVVALDYPRMTSLSRLLKRTFLRALLKTPACNGNYEKWSNFFRKDGIVGWHFNSWARKRERMRKWAVEGSPKTVLLGSPLKANKWLKQVQIQKEVVWD
ncbi:MAG: adenylate kinase [bacterium]